MSVGRCTACTQTPGCGFCQSTLQCLVGDVSGPTGVNGVSGVSGVQSCPSWSYETDTCPALPHCELFTDCASCAVSDQCAWCASEGQCTTISEAFSRDCRGLVFEPPCPDQYISDNIIVGNLIVRADPTFGGGELNVSGAALSADGQQYVQYSLVLNESTFTVHSGSGVRLASGDSAAFNGRGGNVSISAGAGVSLEGGSGGSLSLSAGDGHGVAQYGGASGVGGGVNITAGG